MNKFKLKNGERHWFEATVSYGLSLKISSCIDGKVGSFYRKETDISYYKSIYRIKTLESNLLRVMYA